jgi:hypothetical protein
MIFSKMMLIRRPFIGCLILYVPSYALKGSLYV